MNLPSVRPQPWVALSLLSVAVLAGLILRATLAGQNAQPAGQGPFTGQVLSAPGSPVAGAVVHLVPVEAMDLTTRMTASDPARSSGG